MNRGWRKYSFIIATMFFTLGFFNILFAWFGFVCLILPFILLAKNKRKTWCQDYCPRANLFGVLFRKNPHLHSGAVLAIDRLIYDEFVSVT